MPATDAAYVPPFASERTIHDPEPGAPYRGCRVTCIYCCVAIATRGESTTTNRGRTHDLGARRAALQRGWNAFANQTPADSNGWPDQSDVVIIQDAIAPGLPRPKVRTSTDGADLWERIPTNAISLAIYTGAVPPGNAIRRYVGAVAHQVVVYRRKVVNGDKLVKIIDPMHPQSKTYEGHWVSWSALKKCAKAVPASLGGGPGGRFFYETYPKGGWTAEARARRALNGRIASLLLDASGLKSRADGLERDLATAQREADAAEAALAECRDGCDEDEAVSDFADRVVAYINRSKENRP
jgi:hypothetical protein